MTHIDLKSWQTEGLRHSAFLLEPLSLTDISLWEPLLGHPPAERSSKPLEQFVKEEGPFSDGWLSVEARANRIDWRLGYNPRNIPQALPVVGPYDKLQESFLSLMQQWLRTCPATNRLAYGAVLLLPRDSLSEAYSTLDGLLSDVHINSQTARDFLYRINRRRQSENLGNRVEINRLSTWSVIEIARIDIDISSGKARNILNALDGKLCRLELDINTVPEFEGPISAEEAAILTQELFTFASEIASNGDNV